MWKFLHEVMLLILSCAGVFALGTMIAEVHPALGVIVVIVGELYTVASFAYRISPNPTSHGIAFSWFGVDKTTLS